MPSLAGKTLFITGASRGIGLAIALRAARDGANIAIAAKTAEPHAKLPGTIYSAAKEVEAAGGRALPIVCDIREEDQVFAAVEKTVSTFGGIDILVNNASAISLTGTLETPAKRFDLMFGINTRGAYVCAQACVPHLKNAANPHILNNAPPLAFEARWFKGHPAYSIAKYGMSLLALGWAEEFRPLGIGVNTIWPRTLIMTAAMRMLPASIDLKGARKPEMMADAAQAILTRPARQCTGNFFIDEEVLRTAGVTDFSPYAISPGHPLTEDLFLPEGRYQGLN